jgi:hypothetical protein
MKCSIAVGWVAGLALGLIGAPVRAQTSVEGAVVVRSGPVAGEVEVGRPSRIVVPEREVIVVERLHARRGWWKAREYRKVTVFYDGRSYRRFERPGLRRVIVYERGGRYFMDEDRWNRKRDRHHDHDRDIRHEDEHDD